ncbi:hypothetical protein ABCS02_14155 [Microbacterium sp. X-17]|uniref:hypothetical protein n=1 Tax=Microbacterium sp. X-17 TaxID=3144404 RepID=UPI0031F5D429
MVAIVLSSGGAAAAAPVDVPPEVANLFACPATAPCNGIVLGEPKPVYDLNGGYSTDKSADPRGSISQWIAVAYDPAGTVIGTDSAVLRNGTWVLGDVYHPPYDPTVITRADGLLQVPVDGAALYALNGDTISGIYGQATRRVPSPTTVESAQASVTAWARQAPWRNPLPDAPTNPILVGVVGLGGAAILAAFVFFTRPQRRRPASPEPEHGARPGPPERGAL